MRGCRIRGRACLQAPSHSTAAAVLRPQRHQLPPLVDEVTAVGVAIEAEDRRHSATASVYCLSTTNTLSSAISQRSSPSSEPASSPALLYRNYCSFHPASCPVPSPPDPSADPWMADNATDVADNGTVPSPGTHWISPDVWNRRMAVTTDACVQPVDAYGDHVTTGGVVRDCGTSTDHENPVSGVTNYVYGTLRNTRPDSPRVVYAEVGVYYALASSGLAYPANFTMIPESRQFIALHLEPGTTTSIGPIPWVAPPVPPANDHYCLYMRVLSVQAASPAEGMGIDTDVANNNSLAWRNIKVVAPGDTSAPSFFIVRNLGRRAERLTLRFDVSPALVRARVSIRVSLDDALTRALRAGKAKLDGLKRDAKGGFLVTNMKSAFVGLLVAPRAEGHVKVELGPNKLAARGDITITQMSPKGVDGGVTLRLASGSSIRSQSRGQLPLPLCSSGT